MKKTTVFFLAFISIIIIGSENLFSQSPVISKKVAVHAEDGWQDSGVKLKAGQYYLVSARGTWVSGYETQYSGPDGLGCGTLTNNALLGFISEKKPPKLNYDSFKREIVSRVILIGKGGLFKAVGDGKLWLGMGDWSESKERAGELEVLIVIYE
ncbi:MAG: hypothetical protein JW755_01180 [Candidatus Aminicenantes bacterium]|nr:hypothetical protein [Candidatus Aminicenantes bacterium]